MTDKHPMDDVPMPEPYWETINSSWHGGYHPDQLRAERIAAYELGRNAGLEAVQRERESFKAFLREMHADHNDQHNHFHWALNEWMRRTEATQGETK